MHAFRRHIQPKQLDRDKTILIRLVRTKNRAKRSSSNLMQYAKWTERVRERSGARGFRVQRETPVRKGEKMLTHAPVLQ